MSITRFIRWLLSIFGLLKHPSAKPAAAQTSPVIASLPTRSPQPPPEQEETGPLPYHVQASLLHRSELNFYQVLCGVVGTQAVICPKVRLSDIFSVRVNERTDYYKYLNKIGSKHVDFLLCSPPTMQPLVAIELDDKSHARPDRQERDAFVNEVFAAAGLGLLHIPVKHTYIPEELRTELAPYLSTSRPDTAENPAHNTPSAPATQAAPTCPSCGKLMVLRTARQGANAGNPFWGCSGYPMCRMMLPYTK